MHFEEVDAPARMTNRESVKRYRKTPKGQATQNRYRKRTSTWHTKKSYTSRPFIGWDGEGETLPTGQHIYTLLASSEGHRIENANGLSTIAIFELLLQGKRDHPTGIHVIYGGSYDVNMALRDVPKDALDKLYERGHVYWNRYRIEWRRGKSFRVTNRETETTITLYDVVSFFQRPFVEACESYLGDKFIERELIIKNKARRGTFTSDDAEEVERYNRAELANLVALMTELRERLVKVNLRPRRWDGPGAIASALLQREGIKDAMAKCPPAVAKAARFAYAGGRFEVIRCGDVEAPAYEYDINSAYPAALRFVPNLQQGKWKRDRGDEGFATVDFAVYKVRWEGLPENINLPQPFFCRGPKGTVSYPRECTGWYWAPEVKAAEAYVDKYGGHLTILDGWKFHPSTDVKPFEFVDRMYLKRAALKKAGDGAHVGVKLGLNSLYGKTCQRVGWKLTDQGLKTPPFHQLEWAGYVTSWCRARVLTATLHDLASVIAFETDALFTSAPMPVPISDALGDFGEIAFSHLCYAQSGLYFGTDGKGELIAKTRGVDRGSLDYAQARQRLGRQHAYDRYVDASLSRFIGIGLARALNNWDRWCTWETNPKRIMLDPHGKRIHERCEECRDRGGLATGTWHTTFPPFGGMQFSHEYPIPWINPNPEMTDLDEWHESRREEMAADYE